MKITEHPFKRFWNTDVTERNLMSAIDTDSAKVGVWTPFPFDVHGFASHVLDFGCGVGRNVMAIRERFGQRVVGFDVPERIEHHVLPEAREQYERLSSDWQQVKLLRYHTVVAVHVLQHLDVSLLQQYVQDLCMYSPEHRLVLATRWWMDDDQQSVSRLLEPYYKNVPDVRKHEQDEFHWYATLLPRVS